MYIIWKLMKNILLSLIFSESKWNFKLIPDLKKLVHGEKF